MQTEHTTKQASVMQDAQTAREQAKQVMAFVEHGSPDFLCSAVISAIDKAAEELGVQIHDEDGNFTEESLIRLFERTRHYNPAE